MDSRQRLRALLAAKIEALSNADAFSEKEELPSVQEIERAKVLKRDLEVLREAVDGLDCLDGGEVPEIFKRRKGLWGSHSAAARMRRTEIACYVEVLQKMGSTQEKAIGLVADELDLSDEAIDKWLKEAKKSDGTRLAELVMEKVLLYKYGLFFPYKGTEKLQIFVRSQVKKAGHALQKAMAPKKSQKKKKPKK